MSCNTSNVITFGNPGKNGTSAYLYVGYAEDVIAGNPDLVTGFTYGEPITTTKWIALKVSSTPITSPIESDFQNLWVQVAGVGISPDTNVYNTNGTLQGNRVIDGNEYSLSIINLAGFSLNGIFYPVVDGSTGQFLTTDGSGNLSFTNINTIYNSNGSLNSNRIVDADGFNFYILNGYDIVLQSTNLISIESPNIGISSNGNTGILFQNNLIQTNVTTGTFNLYGGNINVNAGIGDLLLKSTAASILLNFYGNLDVYYRDNFIYRFPTTMPTVGQTLVAVDGVGTLGWA